MNTQLPSVRSLLPPIHLQLALLCAAVGTTGIGVGPGEATASAHERDPGQRKEPAVRDVVLVHGAWADGSSWSGVIDRLQDEGFTVRAVQLGLGGLASDAAQVRHEIVRIGRPVIVVGHSYGGAVIGEATTGLPNVAGLVFVAAYALDQGETLTDLNNKFAPTAVLSHLVFDDLGNATLDVDGFVKVFAPDVKADRARVLEAAQKPISGAVFGAVAGVPGWRSIASWFLVSADDQVIAPDLQRLLARRMKAQTVELRASHASLVSRAEDVARTIIKAAGGK